MTAHTQALKAVKAEVQHRLGVLIMCLMSVQHYGYQLQSVSPGAGHQSIACQRRISRLASDSIGIVVLIVLFEHTVMRIYGQTVGIALGRRELIVARAVYLAEYLIGKCHAAYPGIVRCRRIMIRIVQSARIGEV